MAPASGGLLFRCTGCSAPLSYTPGTRTMLCPYCGMDSPIPELPSDPAALPRDAAAALHDPQVLAGEALDLALLRCGACGAEFTLEPKLRADLCPFCGSPSVAPSGGHPLLRPQAVLPFAVNGAQVEALHKAWLHKLWLAPNALKREARREGRLAGMYLPYWGFGCQTVTDYDGQRGDHYYTGTGKNRRRRTRWSKRNGRIHQSFGDVLVLASQSLPRALTERLEPWALERLEPFQPAFLSGFRAERYVIDMPAGFGLAQQRMLISIRAEVARDIGGDVQRIERLETDWQQPTYRHMLLPIWVAAYRYRGKSYRFLVNGQTGEVQGERPWSWVKITLTALLAAAAVGLAVAATRDLQVTGGFMPEVEFYYTPGPTR